MYDERNSISVSATAYTYDATHRNGSKFKFQILRIKQREVVPLLLLKVDICSAGS